jgi:hypothetical protein
MKLKRLIYSVAFYVLIIMLIMVSKPSLLYDDEGEMRRFGVEKHETIFHVGVINVVIAIISFYVFAIIDYIF